MAAKVGFFQKVRNYLEDVKKEFGKLSYPENSELLGYTYVTIAATFFFTVFIYVVDLVLTFLVQNIYG
jgi:preprotein translocase SecE subunit